MVKLKKIQDFENNYMFSKWFLVVLSFMAPGLSHTKLLEPPKPNLGASRRHFRAKNELK